MRLLNNVERARQMTSLRFNIPNILENKRNVEWMLKQSLKAFKLFQHRFNILSTRFNNVERGWQTLSTLPFNKIERMLKQMLKPFARAFTWRLGGITFYLTTGTRLNFQQPNFPGVYFDKWAFVWYGYNVEILGTRCRLKPVKVSLHFVSQKIVRNIPL